MVCPNIGYPQISWYREGPSFSRLKSPFHDIPYFQTFQTDLYFFSMFFAQEFQRQPSLVRHREATMNSLKLWRGNLRTKRPGQWAGAAAWADFHAQNGNQRLEVLEDLMILLNPLDLVMKCDENTPEFSSSSSDWWFPIYFPQISSSFYRFSPWNLLGLSTTQVENDHVIRFWPAEERWIIDLEAGTWA